MKTLIYVILISVLTAGPAAAETVRVVTRSNAARAECRFSSPVRAKLRFGDRLNIVGRKGDWYLVTSGAVKGCVHKSAVESRSFSVSGTGRGRGGAASADEVSLAGKGFNPQVEERYRSGNQGLNYTLVDEIERLTAAETELDEFILQGGLNQP